MYEKLSFFASLGVREVVIVDRDTKAQEVFRLEPPRYVAVGPDHEGWIASSVLGVRLRQRASEPPRLLAEDLHRPDLRAEI